MYASHHGGAPPSIDPRLPTQERVQRALRELPLRLAGSQERRELGPLMASLAEALIRVRRTGKSEVVLCWPSPPASVSAAHNLACLALLSSATPRQQGNRTLCDLPAALRVLYFPWTPRSGSGQRSVFVDRDALSAINSKHFDRYDVSAQNKLEAGLAWWDFHLTLGRVRDLSKLQTDKRFRETTRAEYLHPSLLELIPQCRVSHEIAERPLLYRVIKHTNHPGLSKADHAATAPYMLFGLSKDDISSGEQLRQRIRQVPPPLHALIVDATQRALRSLGDSWRDTLARVLSGIRKSHGHIPVLAVTDDPFVQYTLSTGALRFHDDRRGKAPCTVWAHFTSQGTGVLLEKPRAFKAIGGNEFEIASFTGHLSHLLSDIESLRRRALQLEDREAADALVDLRATLRRCAHLITGVEEISDYIRQEATSTEAWLQNMAAYEPREALNRLRNSTGALSQNETDRLRQIINDSHNHYDLMQQSTPTGPLIMDILEKLLDSKGSVLIAARNALEADYMEAALTRHPHFSTQVLAQLESEALRLMELGALPEYLQSQVVVDTLLLINPHRTGLFRILSLPCLPRRIILLVDADQLRPIEDYSSRILRIQEFSEVHPRFSALSKAVQHELTRRGISYDPLKWQDEPPIAEQIDLNERTVDLVGDDDKGGPVIKIQTRERIIIRARPKTQLVMFDRDLSGNAFFCKLAQEVREGDQICVLGQAFLEMASGRLSLAVLAAQEVRDYHEKVRNALQKISGASLADKVRELQRRIKDKTGRQLSESQLRDWSNVEQYLTEDLATVRPHAPRHLADFLAFTQALGIAGGAAKIFWQYAIVPTRSRRLRAGLRLHNAYVSVLVDPHALEAEAPSLRSEIRALRAAAEQYVDIVENVTTESD